MGAVTSLGGAPLDSLLLQRQVWRGRSPATTPAAPSPSGYPALDAALPSRGWPDAALSEILLAADGIGELQLLWPTLARLSRTGDGCIALVAPPFHPYPPAWHAAGVRLDALQVIRARTPRDALWTTEQCLRSGACAGTSVARTGSCGAGDCAVSAGCDARAPAASSAVIFLNSVSVSLTSWDTERSSERAASCIDAWSFLSSSSSISRLISALTSLT